MGADPLRKDIFVEIDYYPGLKPKDNAINRVIEAFANAPMANPDGSNGITLHLLVNQQIARAHADSDLNPVWSDFDAIKDRYFPDRREGLFYYGLFANQYNGNGSSGIARGIPSSDFIVSLGTWATPGGTEDEQAGTLMHELGHNLGLRHGGNEDINYKPNYFSVMNYPYQLSGLHYNGSFGHLDYSRIQVDRVRENRLNERTGFRGINGTTEAVLARYRVSIPVLEPDGSWDWNYELLSGNASSNLDFNNNGRIERFRLTRADLNANTIVGDEFIASQNDWDNITFNGGGNIGDPLLGARKLRSARQLVSVHHMEECQHEPRRVASR